MLPLVTFCSLDANLPWFPLVVVLFARLFCELEFVLDGLDLVPQLNCLINKSAAALGRDLRSLLLQALDKFHWASDGRAKTFLLLASF